MATYKFEGTIYVMGVNSPQDAINVLQTALDSITPGGATIVIHHEEPQLTDEEPA